MKNIQIALPEHFYRPECAEFKLELLGAQVLEALCDKYLTDSQDTKLLQRDHWLGHYPDRSNFVYRYMLTMAAVLPDNAEVNNASNRKAYLERLEYELIHGQYANITVHGTLYFGPRVTSTYLLNNLDLTISAALAALEARKSVEF